MDAGLSKHHTRHNIVDSHWLCNDRFQAFDWLIRPLNNKKKKNVYNIITFRHNNTTRLIDWLRPYHLAEQHETSTAWQHP